MKYGQDYAVVANDRPQDSPFFVTVRLSQWHDRKTGFVARRYQATEPCEVFYRGAFKTQWWRSVRFGGDYRSVSVPDALGFNLAFEWASINREVSAAVKEEFILDLARRYGPIGGHLQRYSLAPGAAMAGNDFEPVLRGYFGDEEFELSRERPIIKEILNPETMGDWFVGAVKEWKDALDSLAQLVTLHRILQGNDESLLCRVRHVFGCWQIHTGVIDGVANVFTNIGLQDGEQSSPNIIRRRLSENFSWQSAQLMSLHSIPLPTKIGFELVPSSLFGALVQQVAEVTMQDYELGLCRNCGRYFTIRGRARGKGKIYCGGTCKVAFHRKRGKKTKGASDAQEA